MAVSEGTRCPSSTGPVHLARANHDDVSANFMRMPNELKLMFAEELGIHDVNILSGTCRGMNNLLGWYVYRRAKDSTTKCGWPYFLLAVDDGNLAAVQRFIEVGAAVDMTDGSRGPTAAIHSCAYFGHVEIAELLIEKGVNVSAVDPSGLTALHWAVMSLDPSEAIVTLLVEAGADLEATADSITALHMVAETNNVPMVQCLLDLGADPNAADRYGTRPVHVAVANSDAATVRSLLEAGKNVDIADRGGRTALHNAALEGAVECVKVLLEMGADVSPVDSSGCTPLHYAMPSNPNEANVHCLFHLGVSMADPLGEIRRYEPETDTPDCVPSCELEEPNHTVIKILLAAGAHIAKPNVHHESPLS